ncbi:N-acetylmuramoyl-L-alanine amidase [Paenibacillus flagellatus]|uniref:N-acetylmuramoyl-L-alanine amidase n=1 Tax=Paenibacillus flagellatus TaxID=2211139 RepID=A0A2V5K566_9BACL|nr:peptidoglycan recognition family protein [Paenibacillus flagellatus]PYI54471.1 hypothetical protein DLM86_13465 [Paenibacillus flagellatus]
MDIVWKGNANTNSSSREGYVPFVIVDHISVGTMSSLDNWFTDPNNNVSSAHFGVAKDGRIHQYVQIERMAWAQGIPADRIPQARAQVVRDMGVNPNLYCVSIEHEGYDGDLTQAQFEATVWLHRYIRDYIAGAYGKRFPLDEYHVIGHYQVNPVGKPNCPGPAFPWEQLYATLAEMEEGDEEMEQLLAQLQELQNRVAALESLERLDEVPAWAQDAVQAAVSQGLIDTPQGGSYDFYRLLTVLHRKGII